MNRSRLVAPILALALALSASGCSDDEDCVNCPDESPFVAQTSPEAVVANLAASYRLRDVAEYSKLLAPEFVFVFQAALALQSEAETWDRDQDLAGTGALLTTPLVSMIRTLLNHGDAVPASELEFPPGTMLIQIDHAGLEVDQTDGISFLVVDRQDLFFRPGNPDIEENPDDWFLLEWRDLPSVNSLQSAVPSATWGGLKALYLEP